MTALPTPYRCYSRLPLKSRKQPWRIDVQLCPSQDELEELGGTERNNGVKQRSLPLPPYRPSLAFLLPNSGKVTLPASSSFAGESAALSLSLSSARWPLARPNQIQQKESRERERERESEKGLQKAREMLDVERRRKRRRKNG